MSKATNVSIALALSLSMNVNIFPKHDGQYRRIYAVNSALTRTHWPNISWAFGGIEFQLAMNIFVRLLVHSFSLLPNPSLKHFRFVCSTARVSSTHVHIVNITPKFTEKTRISKCWTHRSVCVSVSVCWALLLAYTLNRDAHSVHDMQRLILLLLSLLGFTVKTIKRADFGWPASAVASMLAVRST